MIERDASDLHIKVGVPPKIRETGVLAPIEGLPSLRHEDTEHRRRDRPARRRLRLEDAGEVDFAYSVPGAGRFRANVFASAARSAWCSGSSGSGPTFAEMRLPDTIRALSEEQRGLVLVTGPTGSEGRRPSPR